MTTGKWSESELQFLRDNYAPKKVKYCAEKLNRSTNSVYQKAIGLGLKFEKKFSDEELEYIKKHYAEKGWQALGEELGRMKYSVKCIAQKLDLHVSKGRKSMVAKEARSRWTDQNLKDHSEFMKTRRGHKSPSWKGGVCNVSEMIRGRLYAAWSKFVFQRDDYTCKLCGERGGKLVVHHIRTFSQIRDLVLSRHPELDMKKYNDREKITDLVIDEHKLSDGITLCRSCHEKHHLENGVNCGNILMDHAKDNPQPSQPNVISIVGRKVQRLTGEDSQTDKPDTSAPLVISHNQMR